MTAEAPNVEFYFDPICPWCWMTSRWVAEVAEVRGFPVNWRPMSLAILNEGKDSGSHAVGQRNGKRAGQVAVAIGEHADSVAVGRFYTEVGTRIHPGAREDMDVVIVEALEAAGLPAALAEASEQEDDAVLRRNTAHAMEIAGPDVGVPIISIDGVAFFGPVVTPAPTGDLALQLWDGIYAAASVPGFYELKRGRTSGPQF